MLIQPLLRSYAANLDYARQLVADVSDPQMWSQPAGLKIPINHGAWVLGHLALSGNMLTSLVGAKPSAPEAWEPLFGMRSKPGACQGAPDKAALPAVPENKWTEPFPIEAMRSFMPTLGDGLLFMMTNHESQHLGQLSAWRRALGLPSIM